MMLPLRNTPRPALFATAGFQETTQDKSHTICKPLLTINTPKSAPIFIAGKFTFTALTLYILMKTIQRYLTILLMCACNTLSAQTMFQRTFDADDFPAVIQTSDGGFAIAGAFAGNMLLIKTDVAGDTIWTKTFGGLSNDVAAAVAQTNDGGFVITGYTLSFGAGTEDVFLIRTDMNGNMLWSKTYGNSLEKERGRSILICNDGGFIIVGSINQFSEATYDMYVLKTDANGVLTWAKKIGGAGYDSADEAVQTAGGAYTIMGNTRSFGAGFTDIFLVQLSVNGDLLWSNTYGNTGDDIGHSFQQTTDGGYIITGFTNHPSPLTYSAVYLIKTDAIGYVAWSKIYEAEYYNEGFSVRQVSDGGYVVCGGVTQAAGSITSEIYLIKANVNGDPVWSKTFGGTKEDYGYSVMQTVDGGYIVAGTTKSFGTATGDYYLVKTDANGNSNCNQGNPVSTATNFSTLANSFVPAVANSGVMGAATPSLGSGGMSANPCATGLTEQGALLQVSMYPNPFNTMVTINNTTAHGECVVTNISGKVVFRQKTDDGHTGIHTTSLPPGFFIFTYTEKNRFLTYKLIKF